MVNNLLSKLPMAEAPGPMLSLSPRQLLCSSAVLRFFGLFIFFYYPAQGQTHNLRMY